MLILRQGQMGACSLSQVLPIWDACLSQCNIETPVSLISLITCFRLEEETKLPTENGHTMR